MSPRSRDDGPAGLTPRQRELLLRLLAGDSRREAARAMGLAEGTVRAHCWKLYRKLGVTSRAELVTRGRETAVAAADLMARLTPAQARVAALVCEGLSNKEAAARLGISVHTVSVTLATVFIKLGVGDRVAMLRLLRGERIDA